MSRTRVGVLSDLNFGLYCSFGTLKVDFGQPAASRLLTKVNKLDSTYMLPSGLWCASRARAICRPRSRTCSKLPRVIFLIFRVPTQHQPPSLVFSTLSRGRCCAVHSEKRLSTCGRKPRRQKAAENCGLEAHLGGLCGACTAIFSSSCFS